MHRSKILVRTLFVLILLTGLAAGIFFSSLASVRAAPQMQAATSVVISQFRTSGPNGGNDEFIEFFNLTGTSVNVSGWIVKGSNNTGTSTNTRYTFPPSTTLLAGQHYLIANSSANGYSGSVHPDGTYSSSIADDGGIALIDPSNPSMPVDQVGMSSGSAYKEGTVLTPLSGNLDQSYERQLDISGSCVDSGNNATDFFLLKPSDPQNSSSPLTTCGNPTATPTSTNTNTSTFTPTNTATATFTGTATNTPTSTSTAFPARSVVINEVAWAGTAASSSDDGWNFTILLAQT